jgi:spermidine/putrescine transport system permease protein
MNTLTEQPLTAELSIQVAPKPPKKYSLYKTLPIILTLGPVVLWLLIFVLCPLIYVVVISFFKRDEFGGISTIFNFNNYIKLFQPLYLQVFFISIVIALLTTIICFIMAYPFAYLISKSGKNKTIMLTFVMIPFWINSLIRMYGWITLLRNNGVFNTLLTSAHLINQPLQLLFTSGSVMLGMTYTLFPYMVLPLYSSIDKLDFSLLEAAGDLGARPHRTFLRIMLPLTMPGIFAGFIQVFIPTLGYFFISDLMGGGKTLLIGNLIENQFLSAQNWPFGAALSVVLILFTILLMRIYKMCGGSMENMV